MEVAVRPKLLGQQCALRSRYPRGLAHLLGWHHRPGARMDEFCGRQKVGVHTRPDSGAGKTDTRESIRPADVRVAG